MHSRPLKRRLFAMRSPSLPLLLLFVLVLLASARAGV
jgi:hypothetical protein